MFYKNCRFIQCTNITTKTPLPTEESTCYVITGPSNSLFKQLTEKINNHTHDHVCPTSQPVLKFRTVFGTLLRRCVEKNGFQLSEIPTQIGATNGFRRRKNGYPIPRGLTLGVRSSFQKVDGAEDLSTFLCKWYLRRTHIPAYQKLLQYMRFSSTLELSIQVLTHGFANTAPHQACQQYLDFDL